MMMSPIERVAQALLAARGQHHPCDASPFANALASPADAFSVQDLVARGMTPRCDGMARHWKTGAANSDGLEPHAPLPAPGVWTSPADARDWSFNIRLVEAEIAFRLARDVTPALAAELDRVAAARLIDAVAVAIELVDSRWQQGIAAPALLKLADLQSHGALVLGAWQPFADRDWAAQACTVQIGSQPPALRRGTHAVRDPVRLVPGWLRHASRHGDTVPAGTLVTTGTWCGMLPAAAGDHVSVRFEDIGEALVQL